MPNQIAEARLAAADQEAERLRKANQLAFDSLHDLLHRMYPALRIPPIDNFEPGSKWQQLEERIARVEQELEEIEKLLK